MCWVLFIWILSRHKSILILLLYRLFSFVIILKMFVFFSHSVIRSICFSSILWNVYQHQSVQYPISLHSVSLDVKHLRWRKITFLKKNYFILYTANTHKENLEILENGISGEKHSMKWKCRKTTSKPWINFAHRLSVCWIISLIEENEFCTRKPFKVED